MSHGLADVEACVRTLLQGLGEDVSRDGLIDTPKRVAKACAHAVTGYSSSSSSVIGSAVFDEPLVTRGHGGIVLVRNIDFAAKCSHTLMPFHGQCHVAYIPAEPCVLGLSKLARLVNIYSKRLTSQQGLTDALRAAVDQHMPCKGVFVFVHARHLAQAATGGCISTCAVSGCFAGPDSPQAQEVQLLLRLSGVKLGTLQAVPTGGAHSGAATTLSMLGKEHAPMVLAVLRMHELLLAGTGATVSQQAAACYTEALLRQTTGYRATLAGVLAKHAGAVCTPGAAPASPAASACGSDGTGSCASADAAFPGGCCSMEASDTESDVLAAGGPAAWQQHCEGRVQLCELALALPADILVGGAGEGGSAMQLWRVAFASQCEHHMLPFYGTLYVMLDARCAVPAALVRDVVDLFACRLQIQERITNQVADALHQVTQGRGVFVICDAAHMCMVARGVEKHTSSTMTTAARGTPVRGRALQNRLIGLVLSAVSGPAQ